MAEFQFDPIDGFKNATSFPNPSTETEARTQIQSLLDQARDAINQLELLKATKEEVAAIILGQITDGSLPDIKLSDEAGQIKDRLATHLLAYAAFVATKGQVDGLASLGADSKLIASQLPVSVVSGVYTGDGTALRFIDLGFTPIAVLVMDSNGRSYTTLHYGGLAVTGGDVGSTALKLVTGGFNAYYAEGSVLTNQNTLGYRYLAFK